MSFFYDLNARLAKLAAEQDAKQISEDVKASAPKSQLAESLAVAETDYSAKKAAAGKDIGKPGKNFSKIAKSAGAKYGSKAAGERVAGAVLNKLRHPKESMGMADEGNAFSGAVVKAKADGIQPGEKINVGGKTYPVKEAGTPMTPKQKSFAKLAPPTDKITFADKIAGAKKEVDEMLGDVAAEAMRKAVVGHAGEQEMDEGYAEMDAWLKNREKEKGTGRFDKKKISTGTVYTRKPETFDEPEGDEETGPKKKGRPAGTRRAIGAKVKGTSKLHRKDAIAEEDHEVCSECGQPIVYEKAPPGAKAERMVKHIKKSLSKDGKLSDKDKAIAYATTWKAKKAGKVEEESTEKEDQKAERAGKKVAKDIEHDEGHKAKGDNKAEKAGKKVTKDIEYDDKKDKEEKVDETTTSGSVATSTVAPKASKGGMQYGKGVYESLNKKLETMISEGMNITVNMGSEEGTGDTRKSITVTATDDDADKLAELLKMAGLEQKQEVCPGCGSTDCGCEEEIDENSPDWPTNTEKLDAEPNLRTYSGGLNGPKSTGQTTTPVIASQLRRQVSMEENVELERTLFKTWKNYKG